MTIENDNDRSAASLGEASIVQGRELEQRPDASFREIMRTGWRVANAAWIFALLAFLVVAPHQASGAAVAMYSLNGAYKPTGPTPAFTPTLITIMVLSLGSCVWMVVEFFAVPWVHGAAACQIRDRMVFPNRLPGSVVDAANGVFGRVLVLTIIYWLLIAACSGPGIIATQLLARQKAIDVYQNPQQMADLARHPILVAISLSAMVFGLIGALTLQSCIAAIVCEDQGIIGAIQRGFSFLLQFKGDAWRLFLLGLAMFLPALIVQQTVTFVGFGWSFVAVTIAAAALAAYFNLVLQSILIALYLGRRRADVVVFDPHRQ